MSLAVTIGSAVVIVLMTLLGTFRDLPRGITVLAGVLLGVVLVDVWATPLANDLAKRFGNPDLALFQRFASILILALSVVVLGYGSGLLLPKITGSRLATRSAGAVIGLFSGVLVASYVLTYAAIQNAAFVAQVQESPVGVVLYAQLNWLLAGGAGLLGLVVLGVGLSQVVSFRSDEPAPPAKAPASAAPKPDAAKPSPTGAPPAPAGEPKPASPPPAAASKPASETINKKTTP